MTCPDCKKVHNPYECKVCYAKPNEDDEVRHGRGCFVLDEDGGGTAYEPYYIIEPCSLHADSH